ncbi:MAG: iron-containing alcohol dehydrogenase [Muribaculaceae bacterium]|nr:iron-containing alcohol dehydrogenase [Muribaculaceae bacterium]
MENFTFYSPTLYEFGRGAEEKTGMLTFLMGVKKVMIVYGKKYVKSNGLLDRIEMSLDTIGIEYVEFGGIEANPTDDKVYDAIAIARDKHIDGLLAIGGGSVIDTAKAIAAGVPYSGDFWDFFSGKAMVENALPVGVVLTIPGAGSEGSGNAVITKRETLQKISLRTDSILKPRFAIVNPEFTFTLNAYQTACGVVDMMSHIMERYFSPTSRVEVSDRLAEGLLLSLINEAPKALADPTDYQARANIEWAGTLAHNGLVGCGRREDWVSHFMEHEISAVYGVTHGAGLAVVIPAWMAFMAHHKPSKVAQFGRRVFGVEARDDRTAAIEAVASLRAFFSAVLRMPLTFKALGIENPDIDLLVKKLHEDKGEIIGGYYKLNEKDTRQIYELMLTDPSAE